MRIPTFVSHLRRRVVPAAPARTTWSNPQRVSETGGGRRSLRWFRRPGGPIRTSRDLLLQDGGDVVEQGGEELRHAFVAWGRREDEWVRASLRRPRPPDPPGPVRPGYLGRR